MPSTFRLPCKSTQKFGDFPATWLAEGSSSRSSVAPAPTSSTSEIKCNILDGSPVKADLENKSSWCYCFYKFRNAGLCKPIIKMLSFVWKYLTMFIFVIKIEIKIYFFGTPTFDHSKVKLKCTNLPPNNLLCAFLIFKFRKKNVMSTIDRSDILY